MAVWKALLLFIALVVFGAPGVLTLVWQHVLVASFGAVALSYWQILLVWCITGAPLCGWLLYRKLNFTPHW